MKAILLLVGLLSVLSATIVIAHDGVHTCDVAGISFDGVTLNEKFDAKTLYYTASVANKVATTSVYVNQIDQMAIVNFRLNGGAWSQIAGFNLPNAQFGLNVGSNTIEIEVICAECKSITTIVITRGGGVVGDPQFSGLKGQSYQVHGVAGEVYNIISDPRMQMNARFVFLNEGKCPTIDGQRQQNCFSHAGSYLGEIGIETAAGDKIELISGPAELGYTSVSVNGKPVEVGQETNLNGAFISRNSTHLVTIQASVFSLELESSDLFINQQVRVNDWDLVKKAHGMLGQTWSTKTYPNKIKHIEGQVDDYLVQEKDLFGSNYVYNRFD